MQDIKEFVQKKQEVSAVELMCFLRSKLEQPELADAISEFHMTSPSNNQKSSTIPQEKISAPSLTHFNPVFSSILPQFPSHYSHYSETQHTLNNKRRSRYMDVNGADGFDVEKKRMRRIDQDDKPDSE